MDSKIKVSVLLLTFFICLDTATGKDKSALIIIDVQNCFTSGGTLAVPDGDEVIPVINKMRRDYPDLFDVTALSQDWHCATHVSFASQFAGYSVNDRIALSYTASGAMCRSDNVTNDYAVNCTGISATKLTQVLWPDHCVINTTDAEFKSTLDIKPTDYVVQKGTICHLDSYSAFYDNGRFGQTALNSFLKQNDIKKIYITGLATDFCVYWTSKDGKELGYDTYVVVDATRGISEGSIKAALADMESRGIHVVNSTDLSNPKPSRAATGTSGDFHVTVFVLTALLTLFW